MNLEEKIMKTNSIIDAVEDLIDELEDFCINSDFDKVVAQRERITRGLELIAESVEEEE